MRDHTVGVVGGEINHGVVEVLKKEYDLGRANVTFKDIAPADARRAVQAKEVAALLLVMPLTDRNLSFVKGLFRESANSAPVLIPIDSAGAIADVKGPYESFDIPKGTLRGAPPVPDDDVTTLRVGYIWSRTGISMRPSSPTSPSRSWPCAATSSASSRCWPGWPRPTSMPTLPHGASGRGRVL